MDSKDILYAVITLIGIVITALVTKSSFQHELDKRISVLETKVDSMKEDIKSHNHYAKLFSENIPVINEKVKVCEHRIADNEEAIKRLQH